MYILDTDHLSLIQRGSLPGQAILTRLINSRIPFTTTIVTYEEQARGWLDHLSRAKSIDQQIEAYQRLQAHTLHYRNIDVLPFTPVAAQEYSRLRKVLPRLGTMDLKIGAIALTYPAILLTRNQRDFQQIPDLQIEDWTY
jgi:tRNA(fMet)-specific endonuclease VapC